jgi:F-type H+-transporting ATPase subunit delta
MAGRYASALFALADERGVITETATELDAFASLLEDSADLRRLVRSPVFSAEAQTRAIAAVLAKTGIGGLAANFFQLIATKRRLFAVSDMIRAYHRLMDARMGVVRAEVTVAEPLRDEHRAAIEGAVRQAANAHSVLVNLKVDPEIIGGLIVRLGSRMVDGSLRTKLNTLRTRMKEVH